MWETASLNYGSEEALLRLAVVCQEGRVGQSTHPLPRLLPPVSFLSHHESLRGRRGS